MDLAVANVAICRKLIPQLVQIAPRAILLLVTNPVDVITYVALKLSGLPARRVFGSGTVLDSSRFRYLIAQRCRVAVQNVHAYIVGEHGDSELPLWSSATIASIPLLDWSVSGRARLSADDREQIVSAVKSAAYQIIQGKGATNYAIGLATARILESILYDEDRVLPVSSLLNGYEGIDDVCLSVPAIVDRDGVDVPLPVPLNQSERQGLLHSAATMRSAVRTLGF